VAEKLEDRVLLAFGYDCVGAVSVIDPESNAISDALLDTEDPKEMATLTSRASLSGVQPKLAIIEKNGKYFPVTPKELSTHIAKFPSPNHLDLVWNEYLTTRALKALLPDDDICDLFIGEIVGQNEPALIIKRFDRALNQRIHFEEFNQLFAKKSSEKYDGFYKDMSQFILKNSCCLPTQKYRLFKRILAGILLGNTDMHFKNFALFQDSKGWQLTPSYDMVCANLYQYKTLALGIGGAMNLRLGELNPKNILKLAEEFSLSRMTLQLIFKEFESRKDAAIQAFLDAESTATLNKDLLIQQVEKRWNSLFVSLGQTLSKKP
jgi:serine/threonine-protein kinase HipA